MENVEGIPKQKWRYLFIRSSTTKISERVVYKRVVLFVEEFGGLTVQQSDIIAFIKPFL